MRASRRPSSASSESRPCRRSGSDPSVDSLGLPAREASERMSRVILIAWDGADWRILDPLLEQGALPNLQALLDKGQREVLRSVVPTHSWSAWPSFLTGVDPDDHGVYDILETKPGAHKQYPVTYRSIKARTFLDDLTAAGKNQLLLDVPLTF